MQDNTINLDSLPPEARQLLLALIQDAHTFVDNAGSNIQVLLKTTPPDSFPSMAPLLALSAHHRKPILFLLTPFIAHVTQLSSGMNLLATLESNPNNAFQTIFHRVAVINTLTRLRTRLSDTDLHLSLNEQIQLIQQLTDPIARGTAVTTEHLYLRPILIANPDNILPDPVKSQLQLLVDAVKLNIKRSFQRPKDAAQLLQLLDSLLGVDKQPDFVPLNQGDAWADKVIEDLHSFPLPVRQKWQALLMHARSLTSARPTAAWAKAAASLVKAIGPDDFAAVVAPWLAALDLPRSKSIPPLERDKVRSRQDFLIGHLPPHLDAKLLDDVNAPVLRGIILAAGALKHPALTSAIGNAIISAYHKIPEYGARSSILGNAAILALSDNPTRESLVQLDLARDKVNYIQAQKLLAKAFQDATRALGVSQAQLNEMIVPTYGLDPNSRYIHTFPSATCTLAAHPTRGVTLTWADPQGKPLRSPPSDIKTSHPDLLKSLAKTVKEATSVLQIQKNRLQDGYLSRRAWPLEEWRKNILTHPLVAVLAKSLIWSFHTAPGSPGAPDAPPPLSAIWDHDALVDHTGFPVTVPPDATVTLWHPLLEPAPSVLAWRAFIQSRLIVQPFKQAHREVYVLTDAERATQTYSNRFAAHILRQHQFKALCDAREWSFDLHIPGADTGAGNALKAIPAHGLVAEFFIQTAAEDDRTAAGVALYLGTDQVRFYTVGQMSQSLHLASIPPLVLSEIFRDVDLFVSVAGLGNDPDWIDANPDAPLRPQWLKASFGDLSVIAQSRKDLLQSIIPRLKIAPHCSFSDKWLIVKGKLRTYKIHLGSGNIHMEPNNQYLCIVPSSAANKTSGSIYLPFDGDSTLSIILSKAIMLAADDKITDPTITRQISP